MFNRKSEPNLSIVQAISSLIKEEYGESISILQNNIVNKNKITNESLLLLGFLRRKTGDHAKAAQIFELILGNNDQDKEFNNELMSELALQYYYGSQYKKSIDLLNNHSDILKKYPINYSLLAKNYAALKNWDQALYFHNKYYKSTNNKIYGFNEKCNISKAIEAQTPSIAIQYLKEALTHNRFNRAANILMGLYLLKSNKIQKAVNQFEFVLEHGLLRDESDFLFAEKAYIAAGKEKELNELLRKLAFEGIENPFIHIALANFYYNIQEENEGKNILESYIELPNMKILGAKIYANKTNNKLIKHLYQNVFNYKCNQCNYETNTYSDDCQKCGSFDSLNLK